MLIEEDFTHVKFLLDLLSGSPAPPLTDGQRHLLFIELCQTLDSLNLYFKETNDLTHMCRWASELATRLKGDRDRVISIQKAELGEEWERIYIVCSTSSADSRSGPSAAKGNQQAQELSTHPR
jgi:hypothetical protein